MTKNLVFTTHALSRMSERRVTQAEVFTAANNPDQRYPSPKDPAKMIAESQLTTGQTLRVVYTEEEGMYVIITVIKIGRKRRSGR